MIYKVDFEGQACKQIKEKAESYQYDLKSVLKGIGLLIADMWLPGDSKPQINTWEWLEILEENGFCNSEEFPGYGEYLEVLGQKLFYCTKE